MRSKLLLVALVIVHVVTGVSGGFAGTATAADHADGLFGLSVSLGLAEGPPYAAAAVEIDAEVRQESGPAIASGQLLLILVNAVDDASGDPIGIMGTAVDNGQPFGETGDTVVLDVFFAPGEPPAELPQVTGFLWGLRPDPGTGSDPSALVFTSGEPLQLEAELFFEDYEVEARDVGLQTLVAHGFIRTRYEIDGNRQDLVFEDVTVTPPDASGELRFSGKLRRLAGGVVDPSEPLYRITISNQPVVELPAIPAFGLVLVAAALAMAGVAAVVRPR